MYIGSNYQLSAPWQLIIWKNIVMTIYIHILGHSADAFVRSNLQKFRHTFIHRWRWLQRKVPTSTSGAVWGSVSCPRPLRHADQGNQTSSHLITTRWLPCAPWASLLGLYLLLICRSSSVYSLLCCFIVAVCVCVCADLLIGSLSLTADAVLVGGRRGALFWAACWLQSLFPPISNFLHGSVSSSDSCVPLWCATQLQYNLVLGAL